MLGLSPTERGPMCPSDNLNSRIHSSNVHLVVTIYGLCAMMGIQNIQINKATFLLSVNSQISEGEKMRIITRQCGKGKGSMTQLWEWIKGEMQR